MNELAFSQFQQQLDTLSEKGSIDIIYSLLDQGFIDFPQHFSELYYWKAQLYLKLGESNLALAELHKGIEKGGWWNPVSLTTKPEWGLLYGYDEFDRIVRHCSRQLEKESKDSKWKLLIKGEQSERALFSFHWKGSNVKDFSQYWSCSNLRMGFLQSSQVHAYHSFNWDQHDIALQDVKEGYSEFIHAFAKEAKQMIIGGASQGGGLAIELILSGTIDHADGFLVVVPSVKDLTLFETLLQKKKYIGKKGYMIIGENDPFAYGTRKLYELFQVYQFPCQLVEIKGMGHFFPSNFPDLLEEGIHYLGMK